jgi:choline monooxygenase
MAAGIERASTLPKEVYTSAESYRAQVERIFARSWHFVGLRSGPDGLSPAVLGAGSLDEPVILSRSGGALACFSNVCTHRGAILLEQPCPIQNLRCRYHGRRFDPSGRFLSMPEFEGALGFPSDRDHLPGIAIGSWGPLVFASLEPAVPFEQAIAPIAERLAFFEPESLPHTETIDYPIAAHWALYCDNYLEGFHVPFVHPGLARAIDYDTYTVETFDHASLQMGTATDPETAFALPEGHPDRGRPVGAYYFFLFPSTMINLYPWGLSLNVVEARGHSETRVRFLSFVRDRQRIERGAGAGLHQVEMEDEAVVVSVQRGVRSRLYDRGRYSPSREIAVHHFHGLVRSYLEIED